MRCNEQNIEYESDLCFDLRSSNPIQAWIFLSIFSLQLKKCSLLRRSLSFSFSFLNTQITHMIFTHSQSLKQNILLEDRPQERVSIGCHKTKPKVITTINYNKGKHHTIQWEPTEKTSEQLFAGETASQLRLV